MYLRLTHPPVDFELYRPFISPQLADELTTLAEDFRDLRLVHINSTETGGGVAEILQAMVPLMNSLGIKTERLVIKPSDRFFQVTKQIHNMLQGARGSLSSDDLRVYFGAIREVASEFRRDQLQADVWFLHDPQLLPLAHLLPKDPSSTWVWVAHIDLTAPNREVLNSLMLLVRNYDHLVFSLDSYVPRELTGRPPVMIAPPGIDPLSEKNAPLEEPEALEIVSSMGIDPSRPLITQVSRFDCWKDPWGVIDAYRLAQQVVPNLQLALLGLSQAADDPEAEEVVARVKEHADDDPNVHLFFYSSLPCSIDRAVNAFQTVSQVLIQKSTREGFGLTVTEAMWKGKPVIGGNVGGIRLQIRDGVTGYLVDTAEECAWRIVQLLRDQGLRDRMGKAARESVQQKFLLPRLALDYLKAAKANLVGQSNGHSPDIEVLENLQAPHAVPSARSVR